MTNPTPEKETDFLHRIIHLAATRCSMASWGQPFEAVASWLLLQEELDRKSQKKAQTSHNDLDEKDRSLYPPRKT